MVINPRRSNSISMMKIAYRPIRIPPSILLKVNPDHIIAKHIETPIIVAGMIRYIVKSYEAAVIEIGEMSAAIPIDNSGSVMLEPIKVPIATP